MSISDRMDEIRDRTNAATGGPWEVRGDEDYGFEVHGQREPASIEGLWKPTEVCAPSEERNAEFIAHARTDVDDLTRALRAVLDVCDEAADPPGVSGFEVGMAAMSQKVRTAVYAALGEGHHANPS